MTDQTKQMADETLLPCPFCGGQARMMGGPLSQEVYSVWCKASDCRNHMDGTLNAGQTAARWNRRATPPAALQARLDAEWNAAIEAAGNLFDEERDKAEGWLDDNLETELTGFQEAMIAATVLLPRASAAIRALRRNTKGSSE